MIKNNIENTTKNTNIIEKIKKNKQNFSLLFKEFYYNRNDGLNLNQIRKKLDVNYLTVLKYERKRVMLDKIHKVTIDRALRELIFNSVQEIKLFNYLITDLNFWLTYEQVNQQIPISRYYFKRVKEYILEEVNNLKD